MKSYLAFLLSIVLLTTVTGCKSKELVEDKKLVTALVSTENVEAKNIETIPCKWLEDKIITYANLGGNGIESDSELNNYKLGWFLQQNPNFPSSHKIALKTMQFSRESDQESAMYCKWVTKPGYWHQIRLAKTSEFIVLMSAKVDLKTPDSPILANTKSEIESVIIYKADPKNQDLYYKLNRVFDTK